MEKCKERRRQMTLDELTAHTIKAIREHNESEAARLIRAIRRFEQGKPPLGRRRLNLTETERQERRRTQYRCSKRKRRYEIKHGISGDGDGTG